MTRLKNTLTACLAGMFLLLGVISIQAATLTVNTTADNGIGSLRQAMVDATINAAANTVTFDIPTTDPGYNVAGNRFTINLLSQLPDVPPAPLTISNNQPQAVTVNGNNTFRIFTLVDSAVFTVNNLTISNGFSRNSLSGHLPMDGGSIGLGGGILMGNSSTLHLNRSTISNNTADEGGGIYINASGTLNMDSSTVSGNTAINGGGIFNNTSGTINAASSTIDGNSANGNGGGIYNTATITLTNNTVSSNTANNGGGIYNNFTATLNNNLVALNTATDGSDLLGRGSLGNAFTGTYNLIGNADGSEGFDGTSQVGSTLNPINPQIGPLEDNGGSTFTRKLLDNSPAIDKGNSPSIITDQRGELRPYDNPFVLNSTNGADIGAFEAQFAPTAATVSVSGRIITSQGKGIRGALITMTDSSGSVRSATSGARGDFYFTDVASGATYIFTVRARRFQFGQNTQVFFVTEDLTDIIFVADNTKSVR